MNWFKKQRIDTERWVFRMKERLRIARLEKRRNKAVREADRLKGISGKRHFVLLADGKYIVRSRHDRLALNKTFPRLAKITNAEFDKMVVYSTK
jgi:hypothetical protein